MNEIGDETVGIQMFSFRCPGSDMSVYIKVEVIIECLLGHGALIRFYLCNINDVIFKIDWPWSSYSFHLCNYSLFEID